MLALPIFFLQFLELSEPQLHLCCAIILRMQLVVPARALSVLAPSPAPRNLTCRLLSTGDCISRYIWPHAELDCTQNVSAQWPKSRAEHLQANEMPSAMSSSLAFPGLHLQRSQIHTLQLQAKMSSSPWQAAASILFSKLHIDALSPHERLVEVLQGRLRLWHRSVAYEAKLPGGAIPAFDSTLDLNCEA